MAKKEAIEIPSQEGLGTFHPMLLPCHLLTVEVTTTTTTAERMKCYTTELALPSCRQLLKFCGLSVVSNVNHSFTSVISTIAEDEGALADRHESIQQLEMKCCPTRLDHKCYQIG